VLLVSLALAPFAARGAEPPAEAPAPALAVPLGVSFTGWRGGFTDAARRLERMRAAGFPLITFVPAWSYVGRDRIDLASGPEPDELGGAVEAALRARLLVVVKPHLEPPMHQPGYRRALSDNHSWRAECGWRGFFDLDPMTRDYREGVVLATLRAVKEALDRLAAAGVTPAGPVRFDLGAELMNSEVEHPEGWQRLLGEARREQRRLGLGKRVLLSHNFTHHLEIPDDFVLRMTPAGRRALGRYIAGLDALAISQYMDLTVAVPAAERGTRLPTADEIAEALRAHERGLRQDILQGLLGIAPRAIPPLHIGEFGVGSGGLKHPNLWSGPGTPEEEAALGREIARGHEGLLRYLGEDRGRTARSAVLWVTGPHYDVFGWRNPAWAVPGAAAALRAGLASYRAAPAPP
jgi:hypothetical protein